MLKVVFVHLGDAEAPHLLLNVQRHNKLFPKFPVHLILTNNALAKTATDLEIPVMRYQASDTQSKLLDGLAHDPRFRQGFWRFTIERFFALSEFHLINPTDSLLHIESDVLLLKTFPLDEIKIKNKLAWATYNQSHDVSSLLFSPNYIETKWLMSEIAHELSQNTSLTDMTVLSKIRKSHPERVDIFPGFQEAKKLHLKDCFDSAAIGMWLCGQDPKNHYGVLKLHKNEEFRSNSIGFDPSSFEYVYSPESGLKIIEDDQEYALHCLHIHSKLNALFAADWESELQKYVLRSESKSVQSQFLLRELWHLAQSNLKQGTLLPFLTGIPPIYRMRMRIRAILKSK